MRKPSIHNTKEKGQAILLIAVLMVSLIAMLGLAIDGGGVFLMYRDVQNATDAAGLSAAYSMCTGGDPVESAIYSANLNGFTNGEDNATVTIENPPVTDIDPLSSYNSENYVQIIISDQKPSYFIQIVYQQPIVISTSTIAHCNPGDDFGFPENSALVALSQDCTDPYGVGATGDGYVKVFTGGIYVDQDCPNSIDLDNTSDFDVVGTICTRGGIDSERTITAGEILADGYATSCDNPPLSTNDPLNLAGLDPIELCGAMPFDPSGNANPATIPSGTATIQPGHFASLTNSGGDLSDISGGDKTTMEPGIYCVNGDIDIQGSLIGDGVFIFQHCTSCTFNLNGQRGIDISAPEGGDFQGLLMYSQNQNQNDVFSSGTGRMNLSGTVYVPESRCGVEATQISQISSQFICDTIDFFGSNETFIQYDPATSFERPASFGISE